MPPWASSRPAAVQGLSYPPRSKTSPLNASSSHGKRACRKSGDYPQPGKSGVAIRFVQDIQDRRRDMSSRMGLFHVIRESAFQV